MENLCKKKKRKKKANTHPLKKIVDFFSFKLIRPSNPLYPTASLQWGKTMSHSECPRYDIKQSDGEVPVILELHCRCSRVHSGPEW